VLTSPLEVVPWGLNRSVQTSRSLHSVPDNVVTTSLESSFVVLPHLAEPALRDLSSRFGVTD
jgi:hypothetical protein